MQVSLREGREVGKCPNCGNVFRVGSSHHTRVPTSPPASSVPASRPLPPQGDQWWVKGNDGQTYGPVTKAELDAWVREGRVLFGQQVLRDGDSSWQWAQVVYPELAAAPQPSTSVPQSLPALTSPAPSPAPSPHAPSWQEGPTQVNAPPSDGDASEYSRERLEATGSGGFGTVTGVVLGVLAVVVGIPILLCAGCFMCTAVVGQRAMEAEREAEERAIKVAKDALRRHFNFVEFSTDVTAWESDIDTWEVHGHGETNSGAFTEFTCTLTVTQWENTNRWTLESVELDGETVYTNTN